MPSPYKASDLSPAMVERYGLGRRSWPVRLLVLAVLALLGGALLWAGTSMAGRSVGYRVLGWEVAGADRVVVDFEVDRDPNGPIECAVRAQNMSRIDVGYAIVSIGAGQGPIRVSYPLRTLDRAVAGEVLGCAAAGTLRVTPPQFPPGVSAPEQPWRP